MVETKSPFSDYLFFALLAPAIILTWQYTFLAANDPDGFQRFGSVVVLFAFVWFFVFGGLQSRVKFFATQISERRNGFVFGLVFVVELIIEIGLVSIGTLSWGYGDLFVCWYHTGEWTSC